MSAQDEAVLGFDVGGHLAAGERAALNAGEIMQATAAATRTGEMTNHRDVANLYAAAAAAAQIARAHAALAHAGAVAQANVVDVTNQVDPTTGRPLQTIGRDR